MSQPDTLQADTLQTDTSHRLAISPSGWHGYAASIRDSVVRIATQSAIAGTVMPSSADIAAAISTNEKNVRDALARAESAGLLVREFRNPLHRIVIPGIGATSWRHKNHGDLTALKAKERPCLCCGKRFRSEGRHNRLCDICRRGS